MADQSQDSPPTTEDYLAEIIRNLERIAHALEFLAHRANESFAPKAEQARSNREYRATRPTSGD